MNQKIEITKFLLNSLKIEPSEKNIKKSISQIWMSSRKKSKGGLRLSQYGFQLLTKQDLKSYEIKFDELLEMNNKISIWLDRNMTCPFYITERRIWVFGEKEAVQLVLFSGNIPKLLRAKEKYRQKLLDKDAV